MSTSLRRYFRGHRLVAMQDVQAGQMRYYHFDHQGTTQCLTDQSGAVTDRFAANAWGVQVKRTGTSINRQWYIGQAGYYRQSDRVLDYVRARYLHVALGGFLQRDALRMDAHQSLYVYALNAPGRGVDPTGLVCQGTASMYTDQDCVGCKVKQRSTTYRCKPYQENCPQEDCFLHVCIKGSAMIAARWDREPATAPAAEECQNCYDRVRVKWVDKETHTRVLNQIEVAIVDEGAFCVPGSDPACKKVVA